MATKTVGKLPILWEGESMRYDTLMHDIGDFISGNIPSTHRADDGPFEIQVFEPDADYEIVLKKKS